MSCCGLWLMYLSEHALFERFYVKLARFLFCLITYVGNAVERLIWRLFEFWLNYPGLLESS